MPNVFISFLVKAAGCFFIVGSLNRVQLVIAAQFF